MKINRIQFQYETYASMNHLITILRYDGSDSPNDLINSRRSYIGVRPDALDDRTIVHFSTAMNIL